MSKMLIIAEKPSVAREIANALGGFSRVEEWQESDRAVITSGIGHLVEIFAPEAENGGRDLNSLPIIPHQFSLRPIDKTKRQFTLVSRLMRRPDISGIVNACDAGREGELIFRLIYELAGSNKPTQRMWLQSLTGDAIREAFRNMKPGKGTDALGDAARCRSEADWLVGINGSRAITRLNEKKNNRYETLPVGRVQTPTLAIVVQRKRDIDNFISQTYWEVVANFKTPAGNYTGKWKPRTENSVDSDDTGSRIFQFANASAIVEKCRGQVVSNVINDSQKVSTPPPKLYDLTSLQREANKKYKFSAKKVLDIAQSLYEKHKATTYPRTDATALPEDYVVTAHEVVKSLKQSTYAKFSNAIDENNWVKSNKRIFDNSKITDHFAIIPTGLVPTGLDDAESRIYDMIVRRFLAAFYPNTESLVTKRITEVAGELFHSSGKVLLASGWQEVFGKDMTDSEAQSLPNVSSKNEVDLYSLDAKEGQTKPPLPYTEATILTAMEGAGKFVEDEDLREALKEKGLGTPATRAAAIEGLLNSRDGGGREKEPYMIREGKEQYLLPTHKGMELIEFLERNGIVSLTSPKMTGEWEHKLRMMEKGQYSRMQFMAEIHCLTKDFISVVKGKASEIVDLPTAICACPKCGSDIKLGVRTVDCSSCGLKLWREVAGKDLSDEQLMSLFKNRTIGMIDGFISRQGKKFSAGLKLNNEYKFEFVFEESAPADSKNSETLPEVHCPKCGSQIFKILGDNPQYACEKGDFRLWKVISGRPFSDAEASRLIREGELSAVHGFTSKRKSKFSAGLKLSKDNSSVEFVFEPR